MKTRFLFRILLGAVCFAVCAQRASAQWLTQTFDLKSGWNAVYLHVDASHVTLDALIGSDVANPIQEIWMWSPNPGESQFVSNPLSSSSSQQWRSWVRSSSLGAALSQMPGNAAYLVRSSSDFKWKLKGKPVAPAFRWNSSGVNFLGFPVVDSGTPPMFDSYFTPTPGNALLGNPDTRIYRYVGGAITSNPQEILDKTMEPLVRGRAYWVDHKEDFKYQGPFEVQVGVGNGARFGDSIGQYSLRIRNLMQLSEVTVTLVGVNSEGAPNGQTPVQGPVPILIRGEIQLSNLTYGHQELSAGPKQWTLKKAGEVGSELEVVLGVNRQAMTGPAGTLYASVLRFTDSQGFSQIDIPTSAEVGASTGLWVGAASVTSVNHSLNKYARAATDSELSALLTRLGLAEGLNGYHYERDVSTGRVLVFGGLENKTGSYLLDGQAKIDPGAVARPYSLRLIVHHDGTQARILQRVYYGIGLDSTPVLATRESLLKSSQLASARRISAVHLPFRAANAPWNLSGTIGPGGTLKTVPAIEAPYGDQVSNPFLHTYHPDHDNLDAKFSAVQSQGVESYGVRREITLSFLSPGVDFDSLTRGFASLSGAYSEVVTLLGRSGFSRQYTVRGSFGLNRISDIATLTQ